MKQGYAIYKDGWFYRGLYKRKEAWSTLSTDAIVGTQEHAIKVASIVGGKVISMEILVE
jgi:hypothetical protein